MGQFTESLTILIQGDSSDLQRELEEAARLLEGFQSRMSQLSGVSQQLGTALDRLGSVRSLSSLSAGLDRIYQQIQQINRTPISINVAPAIASLTVLSGALEMILAQLLAVKAAGMLSGAGGLGGYSPRVSMPGFAVGGPVVGEPGTDQIPAWLTAGEFVLNRQAVEELGHNFVTALNDSPLRAVQELSRESATAHARGTGFAWPGRETSVSSSSRVGTVGRIPSEERETRITNVGGMTINIQQEMDPEGVLRNLRLEGIALRNRRG
ncbi:MAG: hypothetical protein U0903_18070 [Planctomycetales bacterium]